MSKTDTKHSSKKIFISDPSILAFSLRGYSCNAASLPNVAIRGFMRKPSSPMSLFACLLSFSNKSESQRFKYSAVVGSGLF